MSYDDAVLAQIQKLKALFDTSSKELRSDYWTEELLQIYSETLGERIRWKWDHVLKNLKEKKHKSLCLWVLAENSRACAFYEALGGQKLGKKKIQIGPSQVDEMCYGWRPLGQIL